MPPLQLRHLQDALQGWQPLTAAREHPNFTEADELAGGLPGGSQQMSPDQVSRFLQLLQLVQLFSRQQQQPQGQPAPRPAANGSQPHARGAERAEPQAGIIRTRSSSPGSSVYEEA